MKCPAILLWIFHLNCLIEPFTKERVQSTIFYADMHILFPISCLYWSKREGRSSQGLEQGFQRREFSKRDHLLKHKVTLVSHLPRTHFSLIFELFCIPKTSPKLFIQMTALSTTSSSSIFLLAFCHPKDCWPASWPYVVLAESLNDATSTSPYFADAIEWSMAIDANQDTAGPFLTIGIKAFSKEGQYHPESESWLSPHT